MTTSGNAVAARLRAASVTFSPANLSLSEGLRAAASVACVVAAAEILRMPSLAWAAIAALWTCMADPGGLGRERLRGMGGFAILSTIFSILGAGASALGWGFAGGVAFLCAFLGTFMRVYGGEAGVVGTLAIVACGVAIDWPVHSLHDLGSITMQYAGGCVWALVLSLTIWRIHPFKRARTAVASTFRLLGGMAGALADLDETSSAASWAHYTTHDRAIVRGSIETSRSVVIRAATTRATTETGERLLLATELADRIFAQLIALAHRRESTTAAEQSERSRDALRELSAIFDRYAALLLRNDDPTTAMRDASAHLAQTARAVSGPERDRLIAIADEIGAVADPQARSTLRSSDVVAPRRTRRNRFAPLSENLTWRSAELRHAARCAVTICAIVLVTHKVHVPFAYWMPMAAVLVLQPSIATTSARAVERVIGSTLGGVLAALLGLVLHSQLALTAAVFPLAMLTMAVRPINYSLFVLFLTPTFVLVADLTQVSWNEPSLALVRVLNNAVGALAGFLGSVVLWPAWEPNRLGVALADAVSANARYASLAFDAGADQCSIDQARRAAGLASSNAEAVRERSALEAWRRREIVADAGSILVLLRGLAGTATAAWLDGTSSRDRDVAKWLAKTGDALSARLRGEDETTPTAPPPDQDGDAGRCVQQMLSIAAAVQHVRQDAANSESST